jgi:hypothetical protein
MFRARTRFCRLQTALLASALTFCVQSISLLQANAEEQAIDSSQTRPEVEDWYWGFNLGGASTRYSNSAVQSSVDTLKGNSSIKHQTVAFDLYFAWPILDEKTVLGIAAGGIVDRYQRKSQSEEFLINANLSGLTLQRFLARRIGHGVFGRLDLGLATTQLERTSNTNISRSETEFGIGFRLAAGYSFPLSDQTRLPISIHWVYSGTGGETGTRSLLFTAGLLF